ncbi:MAG: dTDP-glucose 4,6-dehydratase [Actinobacteria bacterium]|nr:dTDP-glucose 4,6-dehydratase [Actinomycetota bacterium]
MAHVLVTGGAGFIGSHLVDALLASDDGRVTVLDKLTYAGSRENLAGHEGDPRFRFVLGDVADAEQVVPLVAEADRVVHAAAEGHVDRSIEGPREFLVTNVLGSFTVLEACRETGTPMLLVNTDEVYGEGAEGTTFDEDDPMRPRNPYAASKAAAELLAHAYRETYGAHVTSVRGTNAFGPRQFPEKAIPVYVMAALEGRPLPVYGEGRQRREWLFVRDWVAACLAVLEHGRPGEVYNIGGGHELANLELAKQVCALAGAPEDLISFVPDRPGHDFRYGLSWDRLAGLGWKPQVSFEDGLARTVAWYADHRDWVARALAGARP